MADLKLVFLFLSVFALAGLFQVEAASRRERETEEAKEVSEPSQLDKVQDQLMTAFDSLKRSMEDIAAKFNTEDIVHGVQSLTSKLENYAKQAADQFASSASGTANEEQQKPEAAPPAAD